MEKTRDQIKKEKAILNKEKTASRKEARGLLERNGTPKTCDYCGIDKKRLS